MFIGADMGLSGKSVLITAGARGLGLEMAQAFLANGCTVWVTDVDADALERVRAQHPDLRAVHSDASSEQDVDELFARIRTEQGGLDVLINNAGVAGPTGYVETLSKEDWDRTLAVNITGQFLCARQAVPLLKNSPSGSMINLSSAAGHLGFAGRSAYAASKWAVVGFTKTLAIELGEFGVRVNAILPGAVEGDRIRAVIAAKAKTLNKSVEDVTHMHEQQSSLGRFIDPHDVANMAVFLASNAARNINGQAMVIDGHTQALI